MKIKLSAHGLTMTFDVVEVNDGYISLKKKNCKTSYIDEVKTFNSKYFLKVNLQ